MKQLTNVSGKNRIEWVDFAKILTMILVITAHHNTFGDFVKSGINAFHMPLFFFLSGMFFRKRDILTAVRRGAKNYLLPYIILTILLMLFVGVLRDVVFGSLGTYTITVKEIFVDSFVHVTGWGMSWFLVCLFTTTLLMEIGFTIFQKEAIRFLVVIVVNIISIFDIPYAMFFEFRPACMALLFFYMGYLVRTYLLDEKLQLRSDQIPGWALYGSLIFALVVYLGCVTHRININIACRDYPLYPLCIVEALAGVFLCVMLSIGVTKYDWPGKDFLCYLGKNTLVIYCVHCIEVSFIPWYLWEPKIHELIPSAYVLATIISYLMHIFLVMGISLLFLSARDKICEKPEL